MHLKGIGCEWFAVWIHVAQDREGYQVLVNAEMNLRVSLNAGRFLAS
jgi:hypothetical protein